MQKKSKARKAECIPPAGTGQIRCPNSAPAKQAVKRAQLGWLEFDVLHVSIALIRGFGTNCIGEAQQRPTKYQWMNVITAEVIATRTKYEDT